MLRFPFPRKNSVGAHVYLPQSGARGLERLTCSKYYNVPKRENRLTLGLNATKNSNYMKKVSKIFWRKWKSQQLLLKDRKLESQQLLLEPFFSYNRYFRQHWALSQSIFHLPTLYYFKHANLSIRLPPLQEEIEVCAQQVFCREYNSKQLLHEVFFYIIGIFRSVQP